MGNRPDPRSRDPCKYVVPPDPHRRPRRAILPVPSSPTFTVLFALGRLPGWIAHWREMIGDPTTKIGRPRQVYVGPAARDYLPAGDR